MGVVDNVKRILHIVSALELGGAETLIMNVYRKMDKSKIQFDFVTHSKNKGDLEDEILSLGGRIYRIPSLGQLGAVNYVKKLTEVMKSSTYTAVHSHTDYQNGFPALAAKIVGIEHRICHSHSTNWNKSFKVKDKMVLNALKLLIKVSATKYCSCSVEAAEFLFGNKVIDKGNAVILKNGINIDEFIDTQSDCREKIIEELNLPSDTKLIGHIGRFSESKNHRFLLKLIKKLVEKDQRFKAILVGDGPLKKEMIEEADSLQISNHCLFLGVRKDIPTLMKAFDVFLFPSLFEGFGIVTIEAQSTGTPCIISDTVPKETDMGLGLAYYLNLHSDPEIWCQKVMEVVELDKPNINDIKDQITNRGFNIKDNILDWLHLYGIEAV